MYFEIHAWNNQTVETDNLRDIEKFRCVGGQLICNDLILAKYKNSERAKEVRAELIDAFKQGDTDFFRLPKD